MDRPLPDSLAVVLQVVEMLNELGIVYQLGGSFASAIHGVPRQTRDADIVIRLDAHQADRLVGMLERDFYVDRTAAREAVSRHATFNAIHLASGFKADFFVSGAHDFDAVELERSELTQIVADPPQSVYVKSAEDTVLRKLQWFKEGGEVSERQWRDVLGILLAQAGNLDEAHLTSWADALGLSVLLGRAQDEIDRE